MVFCFANDFPPLLSIFSNPIPALSLLTFFSHLVFRSQSGSSLKRSLTRFTNQTCLNHTNIDFSEYFLGQPFKRFLFVALKNINAFYVAPIFVALNVKWYHFHHFFNRRITIKSLMVYSVLQASFIYFLAVMNKRFIDSTFTHQQQNVSTYLLQSHSTVYSQLLKIVILKLKKDLKLL